MCEGHRTVVFLPCKLQLLKDAVCKDIVCHHVVLAVMLVQPATFASVYQIVAHYDACAPFVHIESPTAIAVRIYIVYDVALHARTGRDSEGIYGTHVGELSPSKVMDVVVCHDVCNRRAGRISPYPSHRHAGVAHVRYIVMRDTVVAGME